MLALGFTCLLGTMASGQDATSASQAPADGTGKDYVPELADLMGATQLRHLKLAYAGKVKNWDLAAYEVTEIKKTFDSAARLYPTFKEVPLAKLISEVSAPALADISAAVCAQNSTSFSRSFGALTDACNSCHRVANVGFIAIRVPVSSPFSNQVFAPTQK